MDQCCRDCTGWDYANPDGSYSVYVLVSTPPSQIKRLNAYQELADFLGCKSSELFSLSSLRGGIPQTGHTTGGTYARY